MINPRRFASFRVDPRTQKLRDPPYRAGHDCVFAVDHFTISDCLPFPAVAVFTYAAVRVLKGVNSAIGKH